MIFYIVLNNCMTDYFHLIIKVLYLQWNAGDRCMAVWSKDYNLYKARVIEADKQKNSVKVKYEDYNEEEDCLWGTICPMYSRRSSSGERYRQSRQKRDKQEGHWQVVICTARFAIEITNQSASFFTVGLFSDYFA